MPITLPISDGAWLLELADALDEAVDNAGGTTSDNESEGSDPDKVVKITTDLAEQISKHLKIIVMSATVEHGNPGATD